MKDGGHRTGGLTKSNLYAAYEGQWSSTLSHNGMPELPAACSLYTAQPHVAACQCRK